MESRPVRETGAIVESAKAGKLSFDLGTCLWNPQQLERKEFVRFRTIYMFERFMPLPRDRPWKILDFGCGFGHSIDALLDRFPSAHFVGADVSPWEMKLFRWRFDSHPRVTAIQMPTPTALGEVGDNFDVIQLNAVFEHLLAHERKQVMPDLWRRLAPNGYLVVTETPWRWFPIETHATGWPLVNYLPDRLTLLAMRHCGRFSKTLSWEEALRLGVRGATVSEIVASLGARDGDVRRVQVSEPDARDMLEVWWRGEYRQGAKKTFAYRPLRWLQRTTGLLVSPWINIVLQKTG